MSVTANIHGLTLGQAARRLNDALASVGTPPRRYDHHARRDTCVGRSDLRPAIGLAIAVAAIFLLLTANFQSGRLALAILLTIPAVLCGVLLMLLVTGTTLNIQSYMGAIMAIGIVVQIRSC